MTLDELTALAEQATPGPWKADVADEVAWDITSQERHVICFGHDYDDHGHAEVDDARYIAACSPEIIKALVAVAKAARRWADWPAQALDEHGHDEGWVAGELLAALDDLKAVPR